MLKTSIIFDQPKEKDEFDIWIQQEDVIKFLNDNSEKRQLAIYLTAPLVFIHSVFIPVVKIEFESIKELLQWSYNPFSSWGWACSSDNTWIEPPLQTSGSQIIKNGEQIIFGRDFEGDSSKKPYYELNQKLAHVLNIHYLEERSAWCSLDNLGDVQENVKIEKFEAKGNEIGTVIFFDRTLLAEYSTIGDFLLLRMFDIHRWNFSDHQVDWENSQRSYEQHERGVFLNRTCVPEKCSNLRGIQILDLRLPKQSLIDRFLGRGASSTNRQYATFIALDWKNNRVAELSCNPSELSNYFVESEKPYETSMVFFKAEVLRKYKSDTEKYTIDDRSISCRGAWCLQSYDVNEADQVHTYLIYLSRLPLQEQLHWKQYNEAPKGPISERAFATDFQAMPWEGYDPLLSLKQVLEKIDREKQGWWCLRDKEAFCKVHYPYTDARDEWAEEILRLDQMLVEGFEEKWLRRKAGELGLNPDNKLRALKLMELCLVGLGLEKEQARVLMTPFHEVHNLRSKLKGHAWGNEAEKIKKDAIKKFGTYKRHFEHLCAECDKAMREIDREFA